MEKFNYLPNTALKAEFEEFRKLITTEEKEAFKKKMKAEFYKKTPEEQQAYMEASQIGIMAIRDRVEELIEKVKRENEAKLLAMA
jgi:hypothetical protein